MTARRRIFAFLLGATICFSAAPALASLIISGPMRADATLVTGPQFFAYSSGTPVTVGTPTNWDGFSLDGLVVDPETGRLELDRAGVLEPSGLPWWNTAFPTRVCGTLAVQAAPEPVEPVAPPEVPTVDDVPADDVPADETATDSEAPGRSDDRDNPDSDQPGLGGDRQDDKKDDPAEDVPAEDEAPESGTEPPTEEPPTEEPPTEEPPTEEPVVLAAFTFDSATEIAAGRLNADLADLRVVDSTTGALVAHRVLGPAPDPATVVLVKAASGADLCAYWGDPTAGSVEDLSLDAPIAADGQWIWERWDVVIPALTLESVDWDATPTSVTTVAAAATEPNDCGPCAHELAGSVVPPETGEYRFHLSVNLHGRIEIGVREGATSLIPAVSVHTPVLPDVFDGPEQISDPVTLTAGERYEIRVRSMDTGPDDHLQVAWSLDGDSPTIIEGEHLVDADGVPGGLTHRGLDVLATTDFTDEVTETFNVASSEIGTHNCSSCLHRLGGFVLIEEAGTYRFWISSSGEGSLEASFTGVPGEAVPQASLPAAGTEVGSWDTFPTQASEPVALTAGQVIWVQATSRDVDGAGHLQVGWNQVGIDDTGAPTETPVTLLPGTVLSTSEPIPVTIQATPFGGIEGLYVSQGAFISDVLDTTDDGSNVHGLVEIVAGLGDADTLDVRLAAASSPEGPWEAVGPDVGDPSDGTAPFVGGEPVPLAFDGLRYLRFEGTLTTSDRLLTPSVDELRVTRDLVEASSSAAATSVAVRGFGDHLLFRVKGTVGDAATAVIEVLPNGSVAGLTAETWLGPGRAPQVAVAEGAVARGVGSPLPFDRAAPQHIGVTVSDIAGQATMRLRWVAVGPGGARVSHDIDLVVSS